MERVTEIEQILILQKVFNKVFKTKDSFGEMFKDYMPERMLICPTNGYCLAENQYKALVEAVNSIGETEIYISEIEWEDHFESKMCSHWVIPTTTKYDEYTKIPIILENSLYSIEGTWGILISHEEHAVIGGTQEFITKFKASYTSWGKALTAYKKNENIIRNIIVQTSNGLQISFCI